LADVNPLDPAIGAVGPRDEGAAAVGCAPVVDDEQVPPLQGEAEAQVRVRRRSSQRVECALRVAVARSYAARQVERDPGALAH